MLLNFIVIKCYGFLSGVNLEVKMGTGKEVDLFIKVVQNMGSKLSDGFELFTTGVLKRHKEKWVLKYNNEYNGTSKISLFDAGFVEIVSCGDVCYNLKLNKSKVTKFVCNTKDTFSYFSVDTKDIFFDINENGGQINLEYCFDVGETGNILQTRLNILIK